MGPCCERASACSVGPNLGHTAIRKKVPSMVEEAKDCHRCVKFWETRHLGQTLDAALEPRRSILGRQHQLQQGDCTHWLPPSGTHPLLWRGTPACGQQHQDDVRGSQGECLPNWPSARLTINALRFSSTNRPTQMEDLLFPTCVVGLTRKRAWKHSLIPASCICANRKDNARLTTRSTQFAREEAHNKSKSQAHWRSRTLEILSRRTLFFLLFSDGKGAQSHHCRKNRLT